VRSRDDSIAGGAVAEGGAVSLFINRMSLYTTNSITPTSRVIDCVLVHCTGGGLAQSVTSSVASTKLIDAGSG